MRRPNRRQTNKIMTLVDSQEGTGWFDRTSFAIAIACGLMVLFCPVVYQPAVAMSLICLRTGLGDVLNAVWLWKSDQYQRRGRIVGLFYLSRALWSAGLWTIPLIFVFGILYLYVGPMIRPHAKVDNSTIEVVVATMIQCSLVAMGIAAATTNIAVLSAWWFKTPVWLSARVTPWRLANSYPPFQGPSPSVKNTVENYCSFMTVWVCIALAAILMTTTYLAVGQIHIWIDRLPELYQYICIFCVMFSFPVQFVTSAWLAAVLGRRVRKIIVAPSPDQCWQAGRSPGTWRSFTG